MYIYGKNTQQKCRAKNANVNEPFREVTIFILWPEN